MFCRGWYCGLGGKIEIHMLQVKTGLIAVESQATTTLIILSVGGKRKICRLISHSFSWYYPLRDTRTLTKVIHCKILKIICYWWVGAWLMQCTCKNKFAKVSEILKRRLFAKIYVCFSHLTIRNYLDCSNTGEQVTIQCK